MLDANGLKSAADAAIVAGQSVPGAATADQLDLLCEVGTGQPAAENGVPASRGAGRPPGSANRSTKEWQNFLLSRYTSPLIGLAETAAASLEQLATMLGVEFKHLTFEKKIELLKIKLASGEKLAPYIHQKMPTALDAGDNGLIQLIINQGVAGASRADKPDAIDVEFVPFDSESNQWVSDNENGNSVTGGSVATEQHEHLQGVKHESRTD